MTDATTDFFNSLSRRHFEPMLKGVNATVRFDISDAGWVSHWLVAISDGELGVSPGEGSADCAIGAERRLFDGMATGAVNVVAALMRGELSVEGDPELMVLAWRLFPPPAKDGAHQPVPAEGWRAP
jgi:putative sterol carrier protein